MSNSGYPLGVINWEGARGNFLGAGNGPCCDLGAGPVYVYIGEDSWSRMLSLVQFAILSYSSILKKVKGRRR